MFSKPTTEQVLRGIERDLREQVLPEVHSEPVRVAVQMMCQLLLGAAVRAAHEIAWMREEEAAVVEAARPLATEPGVQQALVALEAAPEGLHLDDAVARYSAAGEVLSAAVDAAMAAGDAAAAATLKGLLRQRSAHEMAIVGALDLVGRG